MKFVLKILAVYLLPILGAGVALLSLGGCAEYQRVLEVAERNQQSFEEAGAELRQAETILLEARQDYLDAIESGDKEKLQAALDALKDAETKRQEKELDFEKTRLAFDQAKAELQDADNPMDYVTDGFGLLLALLMGGGTGYMGGKSGGRRAALEEVTAKKK